MFSVIFPGQGSQVVGMGKDFYDNFDIVKKLLRYVTVRVKKFDLEANYFAKREDDEKKESYKN